MPKVTLSFNLPEEQEEFKTAMKAADLHASAWNFNHWLRNKIKYGSDNKLDEGTLQKVREEFLEHFGGLLDEWT